MRSFAPIFASAVLFVGSAVATVPTATSEGYAVPQPGQALAFPRDHGSHPAFKIEWWYLTGHLEGADGERFGYQATFFRNALRPPSAQRHDGSAGGPAFGQDHLFLAHMAVTDIGEGTFYHEERLHRDGWQAWADVDRLDLRNGNWTLTHATTPTEALQLQFTVQGAVAVALELTPTKPLLRFGEDGTSRKGADPTARSYYLTWSRLAATGTVQRGEQTIAVRGTSWMDHEIASQQLGDDLAGWDWTAIQLDDGWELKAYILRREDGTPDPFSALMWIDPEGQVTYQTAADFTWERVGWWTSPATGARYPIEVDLTCPDPRTGAATTLRLRPFLEAQELSTASAGFAYWEGACAVLDPATGAPVGRAYLELVGYGGDAQRGLR